MYEFDSGQIHLDGVDIKKYKRSSLHKNIAYVSQEPVIFNTTIMNNLNGLAQIQVMKMWLKRKKSSNL